MSQAVQILPPTAANLGARANLPAIITGAGQQAQRRFIEFFTANIHNDNTRAAYMEAVKQFLHWCDTHHLQLEQIEPVTVAAYIKEHPGSVPTVKQHLAALRQLFDYLVTGGALPYNPVASVRGPRYSIKKGKTPVLSPADARRLLDSIAIAKLVDGTSVACLVGLRDRALIGLMVYSFARISAAVSMKVKDYYPNGKRYWIRLHEKGGKFHEMPAHHNAEAYLDAYVDAAGIAGETNTPLFRSIQGRSGKITPNALPRQNAWNMIVRRASAAGISAKVCCHTFRATGITAYLLNGGSIERAQAMANHDSIRSTKLYDRTQDDITLDDVERIII